MLIVGIVLGVVAFIFIVQNLDIVQYDFLFWSLTAPRFLVFIIIFFAGWFLGWAIRVFKRKKTRK